MGTRSADIRYVTARVLALSAGATLAAGALFATPAWAGLDRGQADAPLRLALLWAEPPDPPRAASPAPDRPAASRRMAVALAFAVTLEETMENGAPPKGSGPANLSPLVRIYLPPDGRKVTRQVWTPWLQYLVDNFRYGGSISDQYRNPLEGNETDETRNILSGRVKLATQGYVWRPWLANVDTTAELSAHKRSSSREPRDFQGVQADARLNGLPLSRTPFTLGYQRRFEDSGEKFLDRATATEEFIARQDYRPEEGGQYSAAFNHRSINIATEQSGRPQDNPNDASDRLSVDASQTLSIHRLTASGELFRIDHRATDEKLERAALIVRDFFTPAEDVSVNLSANAYKETDRISTETDLGRAYTGGSRDSAQAQGALFWRPAEKAYIINGGFRYFNILRGVEVTDVLGGRSDLPSNQREEITTYAGGIYNFSPNLKATGRVNEFSDLRNPANDSLGQFGQLSYTSGERELGGAVMWGWFADLSADHLTSSADNHLLLIPEAGHNARRRFEMGDTAGLELSFSQAYSVAQYLDPGPSYDIVRERGDTTHVFNHQAGATLDIRSGARFLTINISASDRRENSELSRMDENVFQRVSFHATVNWRLSRHSFIMGDVVTNANWRESALADISETVVFSDGTLRYQNQRLWEVQGLSFESEFVVRQNSLFFIEETGERDERDQIKFDNTLGYMLGRLQASVVVSVGRVRDENRNMILVKAQRNFGG